MELELDFLPVGEKTQNGDAIVLRYGNLSGLRKEYSVVVIDSGFEQNGEDVVKHIKEEYGTEIVDLVVSTHPDQDHCGGIPIILEKLDVRKIWMHKPWEHTENIAKLFASPSVTDKSVENRLNKSLTTVKEIKRIADRKGIDIIEPFKGVADKKGQLMVIGPDQKFYKEELIPNFVCTPKPEDASILEMAKEKFDEAGIKIKDFIDETLEFETLDNSGTTTAENNSSTILILVIGDSHILFTSDAGQPALEKTINSLDLIKYDYSKIKLVQVPHHGSYRNINPDILNKIIGPKLKLEADLKKAVVSVSKEQDDKHPSKRVCNAFRRRGAPVHATSEGLKLYHIGNTPRKNKYKPSVPLPFFPQVESHD